MPRFRHASPETDRNGSPPTLAADRPVPGTDDVRAGKVQEPPAPDGRRLRFLLVLLRALAAWNT